MKKSLLLSLGILLGCVVGTASAASIVAGGGSAGRTFYTWGGEIMLTPANATVAVGVMSSGTFTPFAPDDPSPITFSTLASTAGRWTGNATDNNATADAFAGQPVWFRILVDLGTGFTAFAYLGGDAVFPANGGGVGDSLNYDSRNLDRIGPGSVSYVYIDEASNRIIIGVPEPSVTVMGAWAGLLMWRRRRRG